MAISSIQTTQTGQPGEEPEPPEALEPRAAPNPPAREHAAPISAALSIHTLMRRRLLAAVAGEARFARRSAARLIANAYGPPSIENYDHFARAMARAGRLAARRSAINVVATRGTAAGLLCYYLDLWAWHHQPSLMVAVCLLATGFWALFALRLAARTLPTRYEDYGGYLLFPAFIGFMPALMLTMVSLADVVPPHTQGRRGIQLHQFLDSSRWGLSDVAMFSSILAIMLAAGSMAFLYTYQLPAKHSPLDEAFLASLDAVQMIGAALRGRRWADHRRTRRILHALHRAAFRAERAFLERACCGSETNRTYAVGLHFAARFRAHAPKIATATSRQTYIDVARELLQDINLWISDGPFTFLDDAPEATVPPRFTRLRRIAPALLRAAVLTGAGIALPLLPGVAASPAAVDSIRTLLWSGAVLSLTVGGISPSDQIMGLLRGGSSGSK